MAFFETHPPRRWLLIAGIVMLIYAVAGNYVALPGYLRYLERGGTSVGGNTFDLSVLIGAMKTILWMYSFQLGVLLIIIAVSIRDNLYPKTFIGLGLCWLIIWSVPKLPAPSSWFYLIFGSVILIFITLSILFSKQELGDRVSHSLFLGAMVFFAFATWEICGFGTVGRILHPEEAGSSLAHNILVTQSTKLMLEFVFAWGLLLGSVVTKKPLAK